MTYWDHQRAILALYEKLCHPICEDYRISQVEFDILMFLHANPEHDTAAEIVKMKRLTKSHVSTALKCLHVRGFVSRSFHHGNRKNVHLRLTPAADPIIAAGDDALKSFRSLLFRGFDEDEISLYRALLLRLCSNADRGAREV